MVEFMHSEAAAIYQTALGLLARREHSAQELKQKLCQRFAEQSAHIGQVIDRLRQEGYQSDARFVEVYIQSRLRKGFGPVRVAQELAGKGIARDDIALAFDAIEADAALNNIRQLWQKKFGKLPQTAEEKYKQKQFLLYRGFPSGEINTLFKWLESPDD